MFSKDLMVFLDHWGFPDERMTRHAKFILVPVSRNFFIVLNLPHRTSKASETVELGFIFLLSCLCCNNFLICKLLEKMNYDDKVLFK